MFHNTFGRGWGGVTRHDKTIIAATMDDLRNSMLDNNKQELVFWCIIMKRVVQGPFANRRVSALESDEI